MIICEHCGASVTGNICEYCDMPVLKNAPPKIIYKSEKSKSTVSFPVIKHKKSFFRTLLLGAVSVFAVSIIATGIAVNQNVARTYIQSPAEPVIEYNYNDDSYSIEEALPVYDANEILKEKGVFPSGTYQIGVDIPEGLYIFIPDHADGHGVEGVYADPECQEQISAEYVHFDGSRIAEISGNGYLEFSWATAYNLDMHPEIVNDPYMSDGMFIVGRDIPAGTYTLSGYGEYAEDAEWYIYSSINSIGLVPKDYGYVGEYYEDMDFENEITLEDGDIFELRDCIIE